MERINKVTNPSTEGDGTSKSGTSVAPFEGRSLFGKEPENTNKQNKVPGGSSTLISFSASNQSNILRRNENPEGILPSRQQTPDTLMKSGSKNIFIDKFSSVPQKALETPMSVNTSSISSRAPRNAKSNDHTFIFGGNEGTLNKMEGYNPKVTSTSSTDPNWTPKPLFTSQKKESNVTDSIFGGSKINEPPRSFKNFADMIPKPKSNLPLSSSFYNKNKETTSTTDRSVTATHPSSSSKKEQYVLVSNPHAPEHLPVTEKSGSETVLSKLSKSPSKEKVSPQKESSFLIAVDIPTNYLEQSVLYNHFTRFGTVKKLMINKKTKQASIYFCDHKSASEAKAKGKKLHPLVPEMKLFFGALSSLKKQTESMKKVLNSTPPKLKKPVVETITDTNINKSKTNTSSNKDYQNTHPVKVDTRNKAPSGNKDYQNTHPVKVDIRNKAPSGNKDYQNTHPVKVDIRNKAPSGNIGSIKDISMLMKSQSRNNYDKFLILDARDKNIRSKQTKVVDVKKARYLAATCPDMCPEKERYSRDIQYDISIYEMTNGEIDHRLTVKKFSRSSADKDEPLPHELRPGKVLRMTMDFLSCNIVHKGDDANLQIELWYNYLLNRTRALRNDIMQQHLLDSNAVYVLERCIRFHIHCSHQLCEESADVFDPKINAEHLSKSMQSLKELYHDLEEKGHTFPNEAEFRSYEILLSVTDGNVIFKYLSFKQSIRNSTQVQFAIKVLQAIHVSNYVQFFNLVKKATYLQACVMHKYFASIRMKALSVIVKAYSLHSLPLDKVMKMLGFADEDQACKYFEYFGLAVEDGKVIIDKGKFVPKPKDLPPVKRSHDLIRAKKVLPVSKIIHNGGLPENPLRYYRPHNSFDEKGFLRKNSYDASDQSTCEVEASKEEMEDMEASILRQNEEREVRRIEMELNRKVEEIRNFRIYSKFFRMWKVFVEMQKKEKMLKEKAKLKCLQKYFRIWREKSSGASNKRALADAYFMARYFRRWKDFMAYKEYLKSYLEEARDVEKRILMRKYGEKWKCILKLRKTEKEILAARERILTGKYFMKWRLIVRKIKAERKSRLYYELKLQRASFKQWRSWLNFRKLATRSNVAAFPAIGSFLSAKDQNALLTWNFDRENSSNLLAHELSEEVDKISVKRHKHFALQKISSIVSWMPFPLIQTFQDDILSREDSFSRNIFQKYFKILILTDFDTDPYLLQWVRTKFNVNEIDDLSEPLRFHSTFSSHHNKNSSYSLFITEITLSLPKIPDSVGASVVIVLGNECKSEELQKVAQKFGSTPYLVLCKSKDTYLTSEDHWIMTKEYIDNPYVSEKLFNWLVKQWKARNRNKNLEINSLPYAISKFIYKRVLSPILKITNQKKLFEKGTLSPSMLVQFYNNAIYHALSCIEKSTSEISDLIPEEVVLSNAEFADLVKRKRSQEVKSALQVAVLPPLHISLHSSMSIQELLLKYIQNVTLDQRWGENLWTEVRKMIEGAERAARNDGFEEDGFNRGCCVPWTEIVNSCILYKLSKLPEVQVAYVTSEVESFDKDENFIFDLRDSEISDNFLPPKSEASAKRKNSPLPNISEIKKKKFESPLLREIREEMKAAAKFEQHLNAILETSSNVDFSIR